MLGFLLIAVVLVVIEGNRQHKLLAVAKQIDARLSQTSGNAQLLAVAERLDAHLVEMISGQQTLSADATVVQTRNVHQDVFAPGYRGHNQ